MQLLWQRTLSIVIKSYTIVSMIMNTDLLLIIVKCYFVSGWCLVDKYFWMNEPLEQWAFGIMIRPLGLYITE